MSKGIKLKNGSEYLYPCPFYPVGSIYISVNNTNPSNYFGGSWEQIKDKFLLCCGNTYGNGSTGGSANHSHSYSHSHNVSGSHYHTLSDSGRACIHHSNGYFWFRELSGGATWMDTAKASISGATSNTSNGYSTALRGNTDSASISMTTNSQSSSTTGSSSNMPPYLAVYVWKRIS